MSHFADEETLALIAKLQATVQEQAAEIERTQRNYQLSEETNAAIILSMGEQLTNSQHKVKVMTDALEEIKRSRIIPAVIYGIAHKALATVKGE